MEGRGLWGVVRISHYLESAALIAFAILLHLLRAVACPPLPRATYASFLAA